MKGSQERLLLRNARVLASEYVARAVRPGDRVIDATMGNGGDTEFLCRLVGETGRVTAFDVQPQALRATEARLLAAGLRDRAELVLCGHERMGEFVREPVQATLFNFGWLPGADHAVTTRVGTSLAALEAALSLTLPGGIVSLCIYPGHPEGMRELESLGAYCAALPVRHYTVLHHRFVNAANSTPNLILVQKNPA